MEKSYVLQAFMETPWAILYSKLNILKDIVARHVAGEKLDAEEVAMVIHGATRPADRKAGNIAILPLFGTIFPRANLMTNSSGATSAERFGAQFAELVKDPDISAIVLDVNSPGGQVAGIDELSRQIYDARGRKQSVAVANHLMASAAYWIGSAANEVVVTPSADVGSIGVFAVHEDISAALEKEGIKISLISEGKYKVEGNPYEPLATEARAAIQDKVKFAYDAFTKGVARNRGRSANDVISGFGEGRLVDAKKAVQLGMADRIATLEETVMRLTNSYLRKSQAQSSLLTPDQQRETVALRMQVIGILQGNTQQSAILPPVEDSRQEPVKPLTPEEKREASALQEKVNELLRDNKKQPVHFP